MAAKHSYGNIGEFDLTVENWDAHIERMKQYFVANKMTCHATDVPPTNSPAGPSLANFVAIDGPAGLTTVP